MPVTPYFEDLLLRYVVRGEPFVISTWWVGFATNTSGTTETPLGRVLVTWDSSYTNASELAWPAATETTSIQAVTLWDSQSGGNRLVYESVGTIGVDAGAVVVADPGVIQLDVLNT